MSKKDSTPLKKEKKLKVEDRSAYNCPSCDGQGLDRRDQLCGQCFGTGKI